MSDSSSDDDTFYDAVGISNNVNSPSENENQNRHSIYPDIGESSSTHRKITHKKSNSISFEEYKYGPQQHRREHTRVRSWSEKSFNSSFLQRKSLDSSTANSSLLVGLHNQFYHSNQELPPHGKPYIKTKTKIKTNKRFTRLILAQTLAVDTTEVYAASGVTTKVPGEDVDDQKQPKGAIWTSRFSKDGKYMATSGQNCTITVWKVLRDLERGDNIDIQDILPHEPSVKVFHDTPVRFYTGHTADVLDLSWSKNNFLVSASMDKTVRLWHVSQAVCLCVFKHPDVVTSVRFHPKDDRFFLSGSLDCKVRLWSIPEKRVAFWNEIPAGNMVTAVGFTLDGRTACVGANTGDVFFFETQGLKYNTQILVKNHRNKRGKKVTGIEPMPGMPLGEERILVTTNDSRIWIVNMKDKSFVYKYKGLDNPVMQIRASFNDDGRYIICGSEDGCVYLWCTDQVSYSPFQYLQDSRIKAAVALGQLGDQMLQSTLQSERFSSEQHATISNLLKRGERRLIDNLRSRNEHFEAHQHIVTSAIFAPTKTRQLLAKSGGDIIFDHTPVYVRRHNTEQDESDGDESDDLELDDAASGRRRSKSSSVHTTEFRAERQDVEDIQTILMEEFVEATPEERVRYDYPESQIIVSADIHGAIKVWRMDSGFYDQQTHPQPNENVHIMDENPPKKKGLSAFFSKFK